MIDSDLADVEARNARRQEAGAIAAEFLSLARHVIHPDTDSLVHPDHVVVRAERFRMGAEYLCGACSTDDEALLGRLIMHISHDLDEAVSDYPRYVRRFTNEEVRPCKNHPEVTRAAEIDHYGQPCYIVAEVTRERGRFSVTGSIYSSRQAFELGSDEGIIAGGQVVDEIRGAFPELRPIQDLHLCDVETGEPMHAESNARYHLANGHAERAARTLRVGVATVNRAHRHCQTEADYAGWIDRTLRPRWLWEARKANEWIDANIGGPLPGNSDGDEEDYYVDLGEPDEDNFDSLRIHARLSGENQRDVGIYYEYAVSVRDGDYTHETTYGGSVADYQDGRVCAREAAFGVLRELCDFADYDSAEEYARELGMEDEMGDPEAWHRCHAAAVELSDHLDRHGALVGR